MILVGRYASPFVRRVGIVLHTLGTPFEHKGLSTATDLAAIKGYNPIARVPAVMLDNGENLMESAAILDSILDMTPGQKLLPTTGAARRHVLQHCAIMCSGLDKAIQYIYEPRRRPAEKVHQPVLDGLAEQITASLTMLEASAAKGTFVGGAQANLADITVAVGWFFMHRSMPQIAVASQFPNLVALSARCETLPAFQACQLEG